jgi:hypothetical protein
MTTKASLLARSKKAETRVARFLWGPYVTRDWKDDWDLSGPDAEGRTWTGEVKSHAWPAGPGALVKLMRDAFAQAEKHSERAFAVVIPPHCEPEHALCMFRLVGEPVTGTLFQFKRLLEGSKGDE